jgi:hypothetical protein
MAARHELGRSWDDRNTAGMRPMLASKRTTPSTQLPTATQGLLNA